MVELDARIPTRCRALETLRVEVLKISQTRIRLKYRASRRQYPQLFWCGRCRVRERFRHFIVWSFAGTLRMVLSANRLTLINVSGLNEVVGRQHLTRRTGGINASDRPHTTP